MLIAYFSVTGNCRKFVNNLDMKSLEINPANPLIDVSEDYIVIAPTYDYEVTEPINEFVEHGDNQKYFKGVVGSGDINFDDLYIFTAKDLSKKYNIPIVFHFEKLGTDLDIEKFKKVVNKLGSTTAKTEE